MCVIDAVIIIVLAIYLSLCMSLSEVIGYFAIAFLIGWITGVSVAKVAVALGLTCVFYVVFHFYSNRTAL